MHWFTHLGHHLFISTFMITSKVICDDTHSDRSWCIVSLGMFALREINQMEREMCSYLEWQLNVEPSALKEFESMVRKDFKGPGSYLAHYTLPDPSSGLLTRSPARTPFQRPPHRAWIGTVPMTLRHLGTDEPHIPSSHHPHFCVYSSIFPPIHGPTAFITFCSSAT